MPTAGHIRIGIDTGGTFTDVVAFDETTGELTVTKTPSTLSRPPIVSIFTTEGATCETAARMACSSRSGRSWAARGRAQSSRVRHR